VLVADNGAAYLVRAFGVWKADRVPATVATCKGCSWPV
jgi:hypothetical protein